MNHQQRLEKVLSKYSKEDYRAFIDTVDMLCQKGIGAGVYQNYAVLADLLEIIGIITDMVKDKEQTNEQHQREN